MRHRGALPGPAHRPAQIRCAKPNSSAAQALGASSKRFVKPLGRGNVETPSAYPLQIIFEVEQGGAASLETALRFSSWRGHDRRPPAEGLSSVAGEGTSIAFSPHLPSLFSAGRFASWPPEGLGLRDLSRLQTLTGEAGGPAPRGRSLNTNRLTGSRAAPRGVCGLGGGPAERRPPATPGSVLRPLSSLSRAGLTGMKTCLWCRSPAASRTSYTRIEGAVVPQQARVQSPGQLLSEEGWGG
jgi:hypothetical protein